MYLHLQVEQSIKRKGELTIQFEDLADRVNSLLKHAENIRLQQQQNQVCIPIKYFFFHYNYYFKKW
jgi:hypothetical protein